MNVAVSPLPTGETITGPPDRLWDVITRLRAGADREILSIDDTRYLISGDVPAVIQQRGPATLRAAIDRGVSVRQVTSRAGLLADQELGAIVFRRGGQARVLPSVPMKLTVIDRRIALLPLNSLVLADGFRLVRDPALVTALVSIHRELWMAGEDPAALDDGPPAHLAAVVPSLASGEPDEVSARRLGMSPRSYSRRVAELLGLLEVRTRFQAGAEAARRGWL